MKNYNRKNEHEKEGRDGRVRGKGRENWRKALGRKWEELIRKANSSCSSL